MPKSDPNPLSEFDLIARFFSPPAAQGFVGVGDDCGIMPVRPGFQLAVSTDTLIEGRHFFSDADPADIGHKALAVNLSDLAAAGAQLRACLLSLSLPHADESWLQAFSQGFLSLANESGCQLIGGDTTRSHDKIILGVTVLGEVPVSQALLRGRAQPDDDIWVTGQLGAPHTALQLRQGVWAADEALLAQTLPRLLRPQPPVHWAPELLGHAHAAIDISDGLIQDLQHILHDSQFGARVEAAAIPQHPALTHLSAEQQLEAVLSGGDEFELCFTAPVAQRAHILDSAAKAGVAVQRIGTITLEPTLQILDFEGKALNAEPTGFDHFNRS
ncbi:MAG TPA: thiamine-phosphate kinase [Paenalcaligenes sp.]|nr:thiamine-phosphate kinase [Paenalcaligenes sp.]